LFQNDGGLSAECKKECGAAIDFRFGPHFATVPVNDSLYGGQAHAGSLEIFLAMKTLKDSKELIGILGVEAHPVVANEQNDARAFVERADFNHGRLEATGELERVREQISEN
jgi:hypothetical protein